MYTAGMCPVLDYVLFPGDGIKYGTTFQLSNFCLSMMCVLCMYMRVCGCVRVCRHTCVQAYVCAGIRVCRHTCVQAYVCGCVGIRACTTASVMWTRSFLGRRWTRPAAEGGGGGGRKSR